LCSCQSRWCIMSDAVLVNPREYDADLHDVYAAFM
jgi:hypothetical protein